ncbi:DUF397 domain-containing protein [Streptosporangium jomthongense]|uniref:DUF397 domain-containing protein n=1 Tax=Streptosporangium jomthongense TaxID=1193683 RepID=A0ABV8EXQ4_9ACTN
MFVRRESGSPRRREAAISPDLSNAEFRKSSLSGTHDNRVEVATNLPGLVAVRDSKNPSGPALM